jgi:hypothetical protein
VIAWFALALSLLNFGALVALGLLVRRFWRQAAPTVEPLLAMLAPIAPLVPASGKRVEVRFNDPGPHASTCPPEHERLD